MKVTHHDPGTVLVESESRPEEHHIVDILALTCSCEAFAMRKQHKRELCKHLDFVLSRRAAKESLSNP